MWHQVSGKFRHTNQPWSSLVERDVGSYLPRLPLGRYEPSSPVGYCAPHANLLKKFFLVQRTGLRKICLFGAPHRRRLKEPWLWEETHAEEVMSLNPSTDITTYMVNFSHSFLVKLYLCLKRPKKDKKRRPRMAHFQKKGAQVLKNECDIFVQN